MPLDAITVAEKVYDTIHRPFHINEHVFHCRASLGIVMLPCDSALPEELLIRAEVALYTAKDNKENKYEIYASEQNDIYQFNRSIETWLPQAIDNSELSLVYQPIVNLENGEILGFETLLRWYSEALKQKIRACPIHSACRED